jgi:hypothetical protein
MIQDLKVSRVASRAEYLSFECANPYYCIASMSTSVIGARTSSKDHFRLSQPKRLLITNAELNVADQRQKHEAVLERRR